MSGAEREKIIKRVKRQRKMMNFLFKLSRHGRPSEAKEVLLETSVGKVRTLWHGFEDSAVKPVFFDMHGGGFILMSADADDIMCRHFSESGGCKVISIDYSLAPEAPFPAAVNEVYAVVKEVYENAAKYGVDPNRMAIGGHSAGGNLATAVCIQANRKKEFGFLCQILDYPPLDLAISPFDKPCPRGAIKPKTAAVYDACYIDPSQAKDPLVSPVYASPDELSGLPPALVILCGRDSLHGEGKRYAKLLKDAGVRVELREYPKEKHGFTYFRSKAVPEALELMSGFLKMCLSV